MEEEFEDDSEGAGKKKRGRKRTTTAEAKAKKGGKVPTLKIKLGKRKKDTSVSLVRLLVSVDNVSKNFSIHSGPSDCLRQVLFLTIISRVFDCCRIFYTIIELYFGYNL